MYVCIPRRDVHVHVICDRPRANAQKRKNRVFLQHHSSGITMSSEPILGMAVTEG